MERHLVLVLPSKNSKEFPYDYETAELMYGSILDGDFSRLTFIDIEGGFASVGGLPDGIVELLEEKGMSELIEGAEVVDIRGMDPLRKDWGSLMCSYFRPMLPSGSGDVEVSYHVGPGSALLTGMMTGLASSTESMIITTSPFDGEGASRAHELGFVKRGSEAYSVLFGGTELGKAPNRGSAFQRNILVRLFEEGAYGVTYSNPDGKWMSARDLSSGEGMPESAQGIGAAAEVLVNMGLVLQSGGETENFGRVAMTYSLTTEGIVAALEARRHHNSAFRNAYDLMTRDKDSTLPRRSSPSKRAKGAIVGFRVEEETSEVSQEDCEEQANRVLNSFDYVCPIVCHIGSGSRTRFISCDPEKWQKNIRETVVKQRKKGLHDSIFYSICGPDWSPNMHFSSVVDALMGLPPNVDWSTDLTRLSAWDQVIFSIASNLLEIPLVYTARDRGKGARGGEAKAPDGAIIKQGLLHVELPNHRTWRLIRDLNDESSMADSMRKLPLILGSIKEPTTGFVISKEDFNRITGLEVKENSRVEAKLDVPRTFITIAYDSGRGKSKVGWKLTESGVIASEFIKGKEGS